VGHPLAQRVLALGRGLATPCSEIRFDYRESGRRIAALDSLVGASGWLICIRLSVSAMETEDHVFFAGMTDAGSPLEEAQCRRFFDLPATVEHPCEAPEGATQALGAAQAGRQRELLEGLSARNGRWFDIEIDKVDRWAEDRRGTLRAALDALDTEIKAAKRSARLAPNLPEKLERQRELRGLESRRDEAWRAYDEASREIESQKDALLDEIGRRLEQTVEEEVLFTVRWRLS
jgi:hypothetical protein